MVGWVGCSPTNILHGRANNRYSMVQECLNAVMCNVNKEFLDKVNLSEVIIKEELRFIGGISMQPGCVHLYMVLLTLKCFSLFINCHFHFQLQY